jgi:hypothetical protein
MVRRPAGGWIEEGSEGPQRLQRPLAMEFRQGVVATDGLAIDEDLGEAGAATALFNHGALLGGEHQAHLVRNAEGAEQAQGPGRIGTTAEHGDLHLMGPMGPMGACGGNG